MDRREFSMLVKQQRENKYISKYRAAKDSGLTEIQIGRIDNAANSYSLDNLFLYLNAIHSHLLLHSSIFAEKFILTSRRDFIEAFKNLRKINKMSQSKAAQKIGVNTAIITGIESRNVDTSIDKFLLCVEGLGFNIAIENN